MDRNKGTLQYDFYSNKINIAKKILILLWVMFTLMLMIFAFNSYLQSQNIVYKTSREFMRNINEINYLQLHYKDNENNKEELRKILPRFEDTVADAVKNIRTLEVILDNTITYLPNQ